MKTQPEICREFDSTAARLQEHGIAISSDGAFVLTAAGGEVVCTTPSVDGLAAFADALDFARRA